ncbi:ankyrin repeat domain-containing protein [Candidatus Margulisiibacteriota bacterium]
MRTTWNSNVSIEDYKNRFKETINKKEVQGDKTENKLYEYLLTQDSSIDSNSDGRITYNEFVKSRLDITDYIKKADKELLNAAEEGDAEDVKQALAKGADINTKNKWGDTALMRAAGSGNTEAVKVLIEAEANVHTKRKSGLSALIWAAWNGNTEAVKLLIEAEADLNAENEAGRTALMCAGERGHTEIVKILFEAGANVNKANVAAYKNRFKETINIKEVKGDKTEAELYNYLVSQKSDIDSNSDGMITQREFVKSRLNITEYVEEADRDLLYAVEKGRAEEVKQALAKGADVNAMTRLGKTALILAAKMQNTEIVKILIEAGADLNTKGVLFSYTALGLAIWERYYEIAKLLIEAGASLNIKDEDGITELMRVVRDNRTDIVKLLIKADVNEWGKSLLFMAAGSGRTDIIKLLIEADFNINIKDSPNNKEILSLIKKKDKDIVSLLVLPILLKEANNGKTALMVAAKRGRTEVVKLLIEAGADLNLKNVEDRTALMIAAEKGHTEIIKLLIEAGADLNAECYGQPVLIWAAISGHTEVVKILTKSGADLEAMYVGATALIWAAKEGHTEIVELLIESGADLNATGEAGETALMQAAYEGHEEIAELLIKDRAKSLVAAARKGHSSKVKIIIEEKVRALKYAAKKGHTGIEKLLNKTEIEEAALIWAAYEGHTEIVKLLIDAGVDHNSKDSSGETALSYATDNGHTEIIKLLIDKGTDLNAKDEDDRTALMLAAENGYTETVKLLIDHGVDINAQDEDDRTALMLAAENGYTETVKLLIDHGADTNTQDEDDRTALMLAAKNGYTETVKLLIDRGADLNAQDEDDRTALMLAVRGGHTAMVKLLIDKGAGFNIGNEDYETALTYAAKRGYTEIVNLLKSAGYKLKKDNIIYKCFELGEEIFSEKELEEAYDKFTKLINDIKKELKKPFNKNLSITKKIQKAYSVIRKDFPYPKKNETFFVQDLLKNQLDCDTSSFVIMALADEMGWDDVGIINLPRHVFIRYQNVNIDFGNIHSDQYYINKYPIAKLPAPVFGENVKSCFYFNRGLFKQKKGDYSGVIKDLDEAIRFNPKDADTWYVRGNAKRRNKDYSGAIKDYNEALRLNPQEKEILEILKYAIQQKKADEIRKKADEIRKKALAWHTSGISKYKKGDYEGAIKDYNEALKLNPRDKNILYNLNLAIQQKKADEIRKKALAWHTSGISKYKKGDYEGAIKDYNEALKLNPRDKTILTNLNLAIQQNEAAQLKKEPSYWSTSGLSKYNKGDYAGAIKDYDQAIKLKSKYAYYWYLRGNAKLRNKDYAEAIKDYDEALRLNPKYTGALKKRRMAETLQGK